MMILFKLSFITRFIGLMKKLNGLNYQFEANKYEKKLILVVEFEPTTWNIICHLKQYSFSLLCILWFSF